MGVDSLRASLLIALGVSPGSALAGTGCVPREPGGFLGDATAGRPYPAGFATADVGDVGRGARWVHVALAEHASIASFANHLLELMALGAPPDLLAEVSQAQLDEVMHTQLALERARELGAVVTIGPLDTSCPPRTTLVDVALGVASEGCVNETLAVLEAEASLPFEDARGCELLETIARDETRHAALAWRTLAWLWPQLSPVERKRVRVALLARWPERWRSVLEHVIPACVRALDARPERAA